MHRLHQLVGVGLYGGVRTLERGVEEEGQPVGGGEERSGVGNYGDDVPARPAATR